MNNFLIDDFIDQNIQKLILDTVTNYDFKWSFLPSTIIDVDHGTKNGCVYKMGINPFQFVHQVDLPTGPYVNIVSPILNFLTKEFKSNLRIIECKFNFLPKNNNSVHHYPHVDIKTDQQNSDIKTAIYYVNDSDGDTFFFDDKLNVTNTIAPKKGRIVIFDANKLHSSSSPILNEYRIVLNTVFKTLLE